MPVFDADNQPENKGNAGKGRPKGSVNKATKAIKEMILQALDEAHPDGGVAYLKKQANEQPVAFMGLLAKVMPTQVEGAGENGEHLIHTIVREVVRPNAQHTDS
jgi:hypothetical protein